MQTLGVVPRLFPEILDGRKTSTIRWRETPIVPGPMRYVCDGEPERSVVVEVVKVTTVTLRDAARHLGREDKWPAAVMLKEMREHYPSITLDDPVQIVEHLPPAVPHGQVDART